MIDKLIVKYHKKTVGILAENKNGIYFQYDEEWIKTGFNISPLSFELDRKIYHCNTSFFDGLFGVFYDSLPDAWGRLLLDKFLIKHKDKFPNPTTLDKLSIIGASGMGALEYFPDKSCELKDDSYDLDLLQKECNAILDSKEIKNFDNLFAVSGSSLGARPKALLKIQNQDYIVKFQSKYDSKNIAFEEYLYMQEARECGINVAECELIKTKKNQYYATKRFDRIGNNKIHMISVGAILECDYRSPCLDYYDLLRLVKILTADKEQILQMFKVMVFNVIFKNQDDHAKNFSFLYNEKTAKYELSPFYDLTPSNTYFGEHTTSINGKGKDVKDEDMLILAKKIGIDKKVATSIIFNIRRRFELLNKKI